MKKAVIAFVVLGIVGAGGYGVYHHFFENTENYRFFSLHPFTGYPFIPASFRNILYTHPNKLSAHPGVPQRQLPLSHRYQP